MAQMDDVAERAGVGLGTVYRHFPTKEQLAAELVADAFGRLEAQARDALAADGTAWDRFVGALRANLTELEGDAGVRAAIANTRTSAFEVFEPALARHNEALGELITAAQEEGTLRRDFHGDDLGMLLCGMSAAIDSRSYVGWHRQLTFALDGLRTPPGQPGAGQPH